MKASQFAHTTALVRGLPKSFSAALQMHSVPISVEVSSQQHDRYNELLRDLLPRVQELPADDDFPDCVFIEDTAVVVGTTALITRPGAQSRRGETWPVKAALQGLPQIRRLEELVDPATLDGGDVMLAGGTLWVGLSSRSNMAAVEQMQQAFGAEVSVIGFDMLPGETLHLKSAMSAITESKILVADNDAGRFLVKQAEMNPQLSGRYEFVYVPDSLASNVLRIGQAVVMQEGYPASEAIIRGVCEAEGLQLHKLCMSELAKADGALTCCSLLF